MFDELTDRLSSASHHTKIEHEDPDGLSLGKGELTAISMMAKCCIHMNEGEGILAGCLLLIAKLLHFASRSCTFFGAQSSRKQATKRHPADNNSGADVVEFLFDLLLQVHIAFSKIVP